MTTAAHVPVKEQNLPLIRKRYVYVTTDAMVSKEGHDVPEGTFLLCIDSRGGTSPVMVSDQVNNFQPIRFTTSQRAMLRPLPEDSALQHLLPLIYDAFLGERLPTLDAPLSEGDVVEISDPIPLSDGVGQVEILPRGTVLACVKADNGDGFTYVRFYHPLEYTVTTVGVSSVLLSLVATRKTLPDVHHRLAKLGVSLECSPLADGGFTATYTSDGATATLARRDAESEVVVVKGDSGALNRLMDQTKTLFARPSGAAHEKRAPYKSLTAKALLTLVAEYALDWGQAITTPYEWKRQQALIEWHKAVINSGSNSDLDSDLFTDWVG